MLRKNTQRSWGMKWLEGVDKYQILTTHKEHGISPETLSDLRSTFAVSYFNGLRDHAMSRFRFHLGTLVILVLLLGVGFAARRESNEIWDSNIFSITLVIPAISILLAYHRTEQSVLARVRPLRVGIPGTLPVPINRVQAADDEGAHFP